MIVGLVGLIGSGKGTVADIMVADHGYVKDSMAATLKDVCAALFNWPRHLLEGDTDESRHWREVVDPWWSTKLGIPYFTPRFALQYLGTDVIRNNFHDSMWLYTFQNRIATGNHQNVVLADIRFKNEVDLVKSMGGVVINVTGKVTPPWFDIAVAANNGDQASLAKMVSDYSHIHVSEWTLVGESVDATVRNTGTLAELPTEVRSVLSEVSVHAFS